MKRKFTLALATVMAILIFQTTSFKVQSHIVMPLEGGLSGDPGQTTCVHCHSDITNGTNRNSQFILKIASDSAGLIGSANIITGSTTYTPHCTQWISLQLLGRNTNSPGNTPKQGFQFTALKANDSMAGSFTLVDIHTAMQTTATAYQPVLHGPVSYVSHFHADSATSTWYFKWTAPDSGAGPVTFYYAGNLGNGDATYNGDSIFLGSVTLQPGTPCSSTGISDLSANIKSISVYPVPFGNTLITDMYINNASPVSMTLLSMEGQTVRELYSGVAPHGQFSRSFEISDLATGLYLVRVQSGSDVKVIKVLRY